MKNLFKIALSAFAALAIVNCTTDTTEGVGPDYTGKTVKLTVNASLDESRTVIGTPEDGKYPVTWSETGEELSMAQVVNGSTASVTAANALKSTKYAVSNNGKNASFSFDVPEASGTKFDYIACYPYSALYSYYPNYADVSVTIPAEQTPSATSADAAASIMVATNFGNSTQPEEISLAFQHVVGYGKMTVKGLKANGTVTNMTLTAPEVEQYLAGPYYYYYNEPEKSNVNKAASSRNYVSVNLEELAVDGSSDFDVWFAVAPSTLETFTVTFTADGKLFTKECAKPISFVAGQVSAFTLDMSEVGAEKDRTFELVTSVDQLKDEDNVLIVNIAAQKAMSTTQKSSNRDSADVVVTDGKTITNPASTVAVLTLGVDGSNYTFFDPANNGYLYASGGTSSNQLKTQTTLNANGRWTITVTDAGVATIKCANTATTRNWLRYNLNTGNGDPLFSCYASGQQDVYLFREVVDDGGSEPEQPAEPKVFRKTTTLETGKEYLIAMPSNGKTYLLRNDSAINTTDYTKTEAVAVSELEAAGFTAQGSTLTGDVTNFTFRYDPQFSGGYFWSTTQENVALYYYSTGNRPILSTYKTSWVVGAYGNANTLSYSSYGSSTTSYLTVNADGEHAAITNTASTVTFYIESDGTVDPDPEEPEDPAENPTTYKQITTKKLPLETVNDYVRNDSFRKIIITVTKGGKTWILRNTTPEGNVVETREFDAAKFTKGDGTITGPVSLYTWDAAYLSYGSTIGYIFETDYQDSNRAGLNLNSDVPTIDKSYPTAFVVETTGEGNYSLKHYNYEYYLTVDDEGVLSRATTAPTDVVVSFYGTPEVVGDNEEEEGDQDIEGEEVTYTRVTNMTYNNEVIMVAQYNGEYYTMRNDGDGTREIVSLSDAGFTLQNNELKGKLGANYTFTTEQGTYSGSFRFRSTKETEKSLYYNFSGAPMLATSGYNNIYYLSGSAGTYQLYKSAGNYLQPLGRQWTFSSTAVNIYFYSKQ